MFIAERLTEGIQARQLNRATIAEMVGVSRNAISMIEKGENHPSIDTMLGIARALNFPLSFFLTERERPLTSPIFFRKFNRATKAARKAAHVRALWLMDIFQFEKEYLHFPPVNLPVFTRERPIAPEQIEDIALQARREFGLGLGPIGHVVNCLEQHGVLVGSASVALTLDAFSLWFEGKEGARPLVVLDTIKDSAARQRFSASHELGHLLLHRDISPEYQDKQAEVDQIESEADLFAGAFLLPAEAFKPRAKRLCSTLQGLLVLKKEWKVSIRALIRRSLQLGLIEYDQAKRLYKTLNYYGYSKSEPGEEFIDYEMPSVMLQGVRDLMEANAFDFSKFANRVPLFARDLADLLQAHGDAHFMAKHEDTLTAANAVVDLLGARRRKSVSIARG